MNTNKDNLNYETVILAGGLGTRLEYTETIPNLWFQ